MVRGLHTRPKGQKRPTLSHKQSGKVPLLEVYIPFRAHIGGAQRQRPVTRAGARGEHRVGHGLAFIIRHSAKFFPSILPSVPRAEQKGVLGSVVPLPAAFFPLPLVDVRQIRIVMSDSPCREPGNRRGGFGQASCSARAGVGVCVSLFSSRSGECGGERGGEGLCILSLLAPVRALCSWATILLLLLLP